jgi:hypothetical protein
MCVYVYCTFVVMATAWTLNNVILVCSDPLLSYCADLKNVCISACILYFHSGICIQHGNSNNVCVYYTVVLVPSNSLYSYHGNLKICIHIYYTFVVVPIAWKSKCVYMCIIL